MLVYTLLQVDQAAGTVTVSNLGNSCATFHVCAMPQGGAEHGPIPDWLDVHPTSGELPPQVSILPWGCALSSIPLCRRKLHSFIHYTLSDP